jgi:hypothetical protein
MSNHILSSRAAMICLLAALALFTPLYFLKADPPQADAPRQPTAAETKDFITKNAAFDEQNGFMRHETYFEDDTLVYVNRQGKPGEPATFVRTWKVKLESLTPSDIRNHCDGSSESRDYIILFATNGDNKVSCSDNVAGKVTTAHCNYFLMAAPAGRTSGQIVNALRHLITLSGGKTDLFEDK